MRRWPVLIAMTVVMLGLLLHPGHAKPPTLDPASSPSAVLVSAFDREGWSTNDALTLTKRAIARLKGEPVPAFSPKAAIDTDAQLCIHPDSSPTALIFAEFRNSGWPASDAALQAATMVSAIKGEAHTVPGAAMGSPLCLRVPVTVLTCDGDATRRRLQWISEIAWSKITSGPDQEALPPPTEGKHRWHMVSLDCAGTGCAWVSNLGVEAVWVPCDWESIKPGCLAPLGETADLAEPTPCAADGCRFDAE